MQRVRMSVPYFNDYGWDAEIVTVDPTYVDMPKDELLVDGVPDWVKIHYVTALDKKWTSKIGFGGVSYRSLWFLRRKVNQLVTDNKFDLIYFSTTQFPVCVLGAYWKKRFKIPYVIDMQDPWHSEYYRDKPKEQQPPKYWLSYRMNKYLEPIAMKAVDGLISVSQSYIDTLKERYAGLRQVPAATITFGAFAPDMEIATKNSDEFTSLLQSGFKNIAYIGRGGIDMHSAIKPLFEALKNGLNDHFELFKKLRFYFIGTSYAPDGKGVPTILPLAKQYGVEENVVEITDRVGFYHALITLKQADALFIPGSDDPKYTASKIYPYILTGKPLLAIFNAQSSAIGILEEFGVAETYSYDQTPGLNLVVKSFLKKVAGGDLHEQQYNLQVIEKYSAQMMTRHQCDLFNKVISAD